MKRTLLLLITVFSQLMVAAQFSEEQIISKCLNCNIIFAQTADLDADNDFDLVFSVEEESGISSKLYWYEQLERGTFAPQQYILSLNTDRGIELKDVNENGQLDIVYKNLRDSIFIRKNLGNLTFTPPQHIAGPISSTAINWVNLDGDNDLDILFFQNNYNFDDEDTVFWIENEETSNFSPSQLIAEAKGRSQVIYKDFDQDGALDVFFVEDKQQLIWYQNDGEGNFSKRILPLDATGVQDVEILDFNQDGTLDIILIFEYSIGWYANNGDGVFSGLKFLVRFATSAIESIIFLDIDNDGDLDFVYNSFYTMHVVENQAFNRFVIKDTYEAPNILPGGFELLRTLDLENDGDQDILFDNRGPGYLWLENDGIGNFSILNEIPLNDDTRYKEFIDIDGDGDIDLFYASSFNGNIGWQENIGDGNFHLHELSNPPIASPYCSKAADVDNDGDLDILSNTYSKGSNWLAVLYNNGEGSFSNSRFFGESSTRLNRTPEFDHPIDVDNDGFVDAIGVTFEKGVLLKNDGTGQFVQQEILEWGGYYITSADFDQDGAVDLISGYSDDVGSTLIHWHKNDGMGNFSPPIRLDAFTNYFHENVYPGDLNNDGYPDILLPAYNQVNWLANSRQGTFSPPTPIFAQPINQFDAIRLFDFTENGHLDIILATSNQLIWYENNGNAVFSKKGSIQTTSNNTGHIVFADLNLDSHMDIITTSNWGGSISWFESDGIANFIEHPLISGDSFGGYKIDFADLDGDGDLDILATSSRKNKISWFENLHIDSTITVSNKLIDATLAVNIYPNPFLDNLYLEKVGAWPKRDYHIQLLDGYGRLVLHQLMEEYSTAIRINNDFRGIYFYRIIDGDGVGISSGQLIGR